MRKTAKEVIQTNVERFAHQRILLPTFKQLRHPETIPASVRTELENVGLSDMNPLNLFRLGWKNQGQKFGDINYLELPKEFTGVDARIFILLGHYFPTGAHKVGATYGPLVSKLVTGEFDVSCQKPLWPSTGNYCRGGAFNSKLMNCPSIAVLPENMSKERFEWLNKVGAEIHATPGCESNVKEVFDKANELEGDEVVVLNQFKDFNNPLWHYHVTGPAMEEVFQQINTGKERVAGVALTQGSGGALGSAYYMKDTFGCKIAACEALECPTLLQNGFGDHRIEGIGDKHIPWIIDVKKLDMVIDIRDSDCMRLFRLFNEDLGIELLRNRGISGPLLEQIDMFGISAIANTLSCIKMAKYYELTSDDCLFTVATDGADLYMSRVHEAQAEDPNYTPIKAAVDFEIGFDQRLDSMIEMNYYDKKRMHNLKYYTWIEQQGQTQEELDRQWYDPNYFTEKWDKVHHWDEKIVEFNEMTGMSKQYQ